MAVAEVAFCCVAVGGDASGQAVVGEMFAAMRSGFVDSFDDKEGAPRAFAAGVR
jgi:hypothetical protein